MDEKPFQYGDNRIIGEEKQKGTLRFQRGY
jgi:hypothetical protein